MIDSHTQSRIDLLNEIHGKIKSFKGKPITPISKIDAVLLTIKLYELTSGGANSKSILSHLSPARIIGETIVPINEIEINKVIVILKTKGLIETFDNDKYTVSFEGDFIIESGGYAQEIFKEGILMRKAKRNEWLISRGAAFAAIFSGCIVLIELIKLLISYPHLFCSHK